MKYRVRKSESSSFDYVVSACVIESLFEYLHELEHDLRQLSQDSSQKLVLIDLLPSSGEEWNRFAFFSFDSKSFAEDLDILEIDKVPSDILQNQRDFYREHPTVLKNSVLSTIKVQSWLTLG